MAVNTYSIEPIGVIHSTLTDLDSAPLQGTEGGTEAWLELKPQFVEGLVGMKAGDQIIVLTWLHLAERDVLQVHPRGRQDRPLRGVFTTRSQDRPNPIGLHQVTVLELEAERIKVAPMEAIGGTPVVDIKPVLS